MKVQSYEFVSGLTLWNYVLLVNNVSAELSCMVIRKGVETESNRKKYRQGQNKPIIPWKTSPIPARCLTCPNLTNFHLFFGLIPFLLGPFTRPLVVSKLLSIPVKCRNINLENYQFKRVVAGDKILWFHVWVVCTV